MPLRCTRPRALARLVLGLLALGTLPVAAQAPASTASKHLPIKTRWAAQVNPDRVLPEYPRPQLVRERWTNLNGHWEYAVQDSGAAAPAQYQGKILVPFAIESQLSGVERTVSERQRLWYRRSFEAPRLKKGERLLLHFGAVDWEAVVYVNGREVGQHRGGYDPFSFDITDALKGSGSQELVVRVWDPTDTGSQPRGKQVQEPAAIWYTAVTGIWQTVWLEPVPATYIKRVVVTPDIDAGTATVKIETGGAAPSGKVKVTARAGKRQVASASGAADKPFVLRIKKARLWSPDDPFLYDLQITLPNGDKASSYFGMRKVAVAKDSEGHNRLFLNNKPLFQFGPLDQGWWPAGLYTAPTDEALRWDIEATKRLGFNMIRKHVKVEPARWYYHTDKMGMLVWQDMPSGFDQDGQIRTPEEKAIFETELKAMIDAFEPFPSIVMWVIFNEGWGQHDTKRYAAWLEERDPTRLINSASGWTDVGVGDVVDAHVYPGPGSPVADSNRATILGEYGGLGLPLPGHTWVDQNNWGYRSYTSLGALDTAYRKLTDELSYLVAEGLAGAVYTQTTDVEIEVNGLITYDREVVKIGPQAIEQHASLYGPLPERPVVMPTSFNEPQTWRYTTSAPDTANWMKPEFDDSKWEKGVGGFGVPIPSGYAMNPVPARTEWVAPTIWMRRTFQVSGELPENPQWRIYHAGVVDLYLNGKLVGQFQRGNNNYVAVPFSSTARGALKQGTNTVAVRMRMPRSWQYIDLGIEEGPEPVATAQTGEQRNAPGGNGGQTSSAAQGEVLGEVSLDFSAPAGSIKDAKGQGTGFTTRLGGSGTNLQANDANLSLDTSAGVLNLTTTQADINGQRNMADLEAVGIDLASLGFTGKEDFYVSARFVGIPDNSVMDVPDQLGIFVGSTTTAVIRAGFINFDRYAPDGVVRSNQAFAVQTNGEQDGESRWLGQTGSADVGETMTVEISRRGGTWSVLVNGEDAVPNTERDGSGTRTPPTFLNGKSDLVVGVFGLDVNGTHKKLQVDQFVAKVFKP